MHELGDLTARVGARVGASIGLSDDVKDLQFSATV